jgi:prolyl oligopeptidase
MNHRFFYAKRVSLILLTLFIVGHYMQSIATKSKSETHTLDPFLWLEDVVGEKPLAWVKTHNDKTTTVLKGEPLFEEIYQANLAIYNNDDRITYPSTRGKYIYNFWQDKNNVRGLWRRTTSANYLIGNPTWETVLDLDKLSEETNTKWSFKGATYLRPDYNRAMLRLSPGGSDAVEIKEFDLITKTFVTDGFKLPLAKSEINWIDKDTIIVGTDFGDNTLTDSGYPRLVKIWKRGTKLSQAKTIFSGQQTNVWVGGTLQYTDARSYMTIYQATDFYHGNYYAYIKGDLKSIKIPKDAVLHGFHQNQMIIELKTKWSPTVSVQYEQGALISCDYDAILQNNFTFNLIYQPSKISSISEVLITEKIVLVNTTQNVRSKLLVYTIQNNHWAQTVCDTNAMGAISLYGARVDGDAFFFSYTDFLTPTTLYYVKSVNQRPKQIQQLPPFFEAEKLQTDQFHATSQDGTEIPYFIVSQKGLTLNGNNPTLLYGYGGFEISLQPRYSAINGTAWLDRGGVYVLANIRGGGEFGPAWHQAALKENRQKAYDDFIAIAEDLIARKITSPKCLGIHGGSNGGLLVGNMLVQRPELFNAIVCSVPLLDMQRFNKLLAGASWMGEYGNPDIPEQWAYLKNYSPYHNLKANVHYPKVFFNTSTKDDRVHPGHARKMVAKLESINSPVYYYENTEGGHAGATTNQQRAFRSALIYTYLHQQLHP